MCAEQGWVLTTLATHLPLLSSSLLRASNCEKYLYSQATHLNHEPTTCQASQG